LLVLIVISVAFSMMSVGAASLYGDLNGDDLVDSIDFAIMKGTILNRVRIDNVIISDLNGDGDINSLDIGLLKMYLLGKIDKFPVEDLNPEITPTSDQ